jgi:RNA polymerase sigma factor (sigma-70 family)
MASGLASVTALRHLHDLFNGGSATGLTDGQLLARYTASNDGPAFTALVARHGPMVAATCRAVLQREHDVEDAFQATFLVLARKAGSVRAGDVLGGWLHRVAYRIAVQANIELKRRRRRESDVSPMDIPATVHSVPDLELLAIVHEEIDRLPERQRLPVVLCDLEGLSYEHAAMQIHATVPALRCRLSKARERLRARLARRGVTASALAAVLASTTKAAAAVAASWAEAAIAAATGGASTAAAAALAQTILRRILITKLKIVVATAVATAAIVSAGVAMGTAQPKNHEPETNARGISHSSAPTVDPPVRVTTSNALIEVHGRVVDPEGRAVAGATVRTALLNREVKPAPEVTSGPDGRFFMRVPPWRWNSAMRQRDAMFPWVVASAPGFGPGWASAVREPGAPGEFTIRLVADGPPIEGRIVDLEGRPIAGAQVRAGQVWFARDGKLSDWLARAEVGGVGGPWQGLDSLPTTITATTGDDGRFRLAGIGHDRIAELVISGPTIAAAQLYAVNRDGPTIHTANPGAMTPEQSRTTYHARRLEYVAAPTKPIQGIIRDKDTGRPIAGVKLGGMVFDEYSTLWAEGVEATTDSQGRYRLTGLPKGPAYRLLLEPGNSLPYTVATFRVPAESPALEPVNFDVTLKRGILVRGRVTDKATGMPVSGYVQSYAFADNPHIHEFPGYREGVAYIDDKGRYEIVALPGRGIIACRSDLGRYRGYVGADAIEGYNPKLLGGSFDTRPSGCMVIEYHVLAGINLDPKAESTTVDLQVDPGRTLTITILDPEGQPASGTKASGLIDLFSDIPYQQESPTMEVRALDPSKPRRVTITHAGRKLIGSVYLNGDETGTLTVRLQPWGTIYGRVVDDEDQRRKGIQISNIDGSFPRRPAEQGILPGDGRVDSDGRFRVEGLVPGLKYGASASAGNLFLGVVFRDVIVAPGEVKDLGDLKVAAPEAQRQE